MQELVTTNRKKPGIRRMRWMYWKFGGFFLNTNMLGEKKDVGVPSLKLTWPLKIGLPNGKGSYSNHHFSRASC